MRANSRLSIDVERLDPELPLPSGARAGDAGLDRRSAPRPAPGRA